MGKGELTKAAILDEAVQIASRVGFGGLSIGQLADRVEMSKSGLFAHFRSKEQLQLQAMERARQRFVDVVIRPALAAPRGIARVRAVFDGWLEWAHQALQGGCIFVAAAAELDDQPGALRDALVRNERDWLEFIATVAGTAVAEGELRGDLDLEQFAFEVHGVMLAHHHASRLLHDERAEARTLRAFESLLAGARPST
ncbi:MAG TPA: TetR/AcrR family transcriptional regulator [Nocardioidaceae bacterium]|nr:TetR/AcrR family transcriptional regulator [Nocardioidaceae bacterium]